LFDHILDYIRRKELKWWRTEQCYYVLKTE
jgi:hypothetical protein